MLLAPLQGHQEFMKVSSGFRSAQMVTEKRFQGPLGRDPLPWGFYHSPSYIFLPVTLQSLQIAPHCAENTFLCSTLLVRWFNSFIGRFLKYFILFNKRTLDTLLYVIRECKYSLA